MELTKAQIMEHAGLVRDVCAALGTRSVKDADKPFIDAICKRAAVVLPLMLISHVRRLYEAAADCDFPSDTVCAFRGALQRRLGTHHNLKELRGYTIGAAPAPPPGGGAGTPSPHPFPKP